MAALEFRVDDWLVEADGTIEVRYTHGTAPLPQGWSGLSLRFTGGAAEVDQVIAQAEGTCIQPDLMLGMLAARFRRQSPTYSQRNLIRGKTFSYDPDSQQIIQIN